MRKFVASGLEKSQVRTRGYGPLTWSFGPVLRYKSSRVTLGCACVAAMIYQVALNDLVNGATTEENVAGNRDFHFVRILG